MIISVINDNFIAAFLLMQFSIMHTLHSGMHACARLQRGTHIWNIHHILGDNLSFSVSQMGRRERWIICVQIANMGNMSLTVNTIYRKQPCDI